MYIHITYLNKRFGPSNLVRIRLLKVLKNAIAVELTRGNHFLDVGGRLGRDSHPAKRRNAL